MAGYYVRRIILGDEIGGEDHRGEEVDKLEGSMLCDINENVVGIIGVGYCMLTFDCASVSRKVTRGYGR